MTVDVERVVATLVADPPGWIVDEGGKLCELVGPIPPGIIERFGLDAADMSELFGAEEAAQ